MPFVVEYIMERPNKEVDFPQNGSQEKDSLASLRQEYNISSEVNFSDDGLIRTLRHTASSAEVYSSFYEHALGIWEKSKIIQTCGNLDIDVTMGIVENT